MRAILAWKVLVACLALAGCAKADDAAAAGFKPRAPTAWSVISSNPTLSEVAGVIQRLGLQAAYDRAFSGTLLLPTNEAVYNYLSEVEPLHLKEDGRGFEEGDIEESMWGALLPYHALPRAVSTRQRAAAVTYSTTYFDAMSTVDSTAVTAARTLLPKPTSSPYHKLTFLCSSGIRSRIAVAGVAPQTRGCQVTGIRDEQNNTVTFASTNTNVLGGGVIHTLNAVLKPNNVYQSLALLLESDPELSIMREIIRRTYPTCLNDTSSYSTYDYDSCCARGGGAYIGNGIFCGYGAELYDNVDIDPSYVGRKLLQANNNRAACQQAGTCALEGLRGTLSLPTNRAFTEGDFGPTNSEGVPTTLPPEQWRPIVQFHFIRAAAVSDFMRYDRTAPGGRPNVGFPNPPANRPQNLLGVVRGDNNFRLSFQAAAASGGRNRLSIQFPSTNGAVRTADIGQADRIIPPHYVHKVNRVMEPPCGRAC